MFRGVQVGGSRNDMIRELAGLHGQPDLSPEALRDVRSRVENSYLDSILDNVPVQPAQDSKDTGGTR